MKKYRVFRCDSQRVNRHGFLHGWLDTNASFDYVLAFRVRCYCISRCIAGGSVIEFKLCTAVPFREANGKHSSTLKYGQRTKRENVSQNSMLTPKAKMMPARMYVEMYLNGIGLFPRRLERLGKQDVLA